MKNRAFGIGSVFFLKLMTKQDLLFLCKMTFATFFVIFYKNIFLKPLDIIQFNDIIEFSEYLGGIIFSLASLLNFKVWWLWGLKITVVISKI